jgi:hypothetical protein
MVSIGNFDDDVDDGTNDDLDDAYTGFGCVFSKFWGLGVDFFLSLCRTSVDTAIAPPSLAPHADLGDYATPQMNVSPDDDLGDAYTAFRCVFPKLSGPLC